VFLLINICATGNVSPCLLEYLNDVVKMLTEWQVGLLNDDGLFEKFQSREFEISGDLMARYWIVTSFEYCWWKDRFDLMPFQMPERLTLNEVKDMCMMLMEQLVCPASCFQIPG
jgi:hypothetical protein